MFAVTCSHCNAKQELADDCELPVVTCGQCRMPIRVPSPFLRQNFEPSLGEPEPAPYLPRIEKQGSRFSLVSWESLAMIIGTIGGSALGACASLGWDSFGVSLGYAFIGWLWGMPLGFLLPIMLFSLLWRFYLIEADQVLDQFGYPMALLALLVGAVGATTGALLGAVGGNPFDQHEPRNLGEFIARLIGSVADTISGHPMAALASGLAGVFGGGLMILASVAWRVRCASRARSKQDRR